MGYKGKSEKEYEREYYLKITGQEYKREYQREYYYRKCYNSSIKFIIGPIMIQLWTIYGKCQISTTIGNKTRIMVHYGQLWTLWTCSHFVMCKLCVFLMTNTIMIHNGP